MVSVATMVYEDHEVEWVDHQKRIFRDKWGALQIGRHDGIPVPAKPPRIETIEDLVAYRPPDPADSPVLEKIRRLKQKYPNGEKAICCVGESGWAPAVFLRGGLENLLLDFGLRPDLVRDLMKIGTAYYCELFPMAIHAGADIVLLGRRLLGQEWPHDVASAVQRVDSALRRRSRRRNQGRRRLCIKHTDGDIRKIMDPLVGTGVDCLGPLEPVPGMELDRFSSATRAGSP